MHELHNKHSPKNNNKINQTQNNMHLNNNNKQNKIYVKTRHNISNNNIINNEHKQQHSPLNNQQNKIRNTNFNKT